jgi:transketolase N-terminal domain/subunit
VLWLATAIVHHANRVRENRSGVKVGGHQASSASMVSLMTALWFSELRAEDLVSVKPHASPVLHAINYVLGRLERPYLESLRAFGGLQSYPSRTKDPDPVDFSTGSVGIGATAPIWAAIARRYLEHHRFEAPPRGREIALLGDAELDEGAVWEAIADPWVARLGEVLWVVDLNRQSLDRVVPRHRVRPPRRHVRGGGLAGAHGQVRPQARGAVRARRGRGPPPPHRRDAERGVPSGCCGRIRPSCASDCRDGTPASAGSWASWATRSCAPPSAISAATTSAS